MPESKEPDMEQRDPRNINEHIKVQFEDVLAEPEGVRSIDCVWRNSSKCFNCTLSCCYKFLTVLCGLPAAFYWGCEFASLACWHVWCYTPYVKMCTIKLIAYRQLLRLIYETTLGACCEACGMCLSKIVVKQG